MNTAELTATYSETVQAIHRERTLANITRRALSLWEDGYKVVNTGDTQSFRNFTVTSPKGERYGVRLSDIPADKVFGDYCSCPAFDKFGECKHHLAVLEQVREDEQTDAEWERHEEWANYCNGRFDR